jgi:hypothetical protein
MPRHAANEIKQARKGSGSDQEARAVGHQKA